MQQFNINTQLSSFFHQEKRGGNLARHKPWVLQTFYFETIPNKTLKVPVAVLKGVPYYASKLSPKYVVKTPGEKSWIDNR